MNTKHYEMFFNQNPEDPEFAIRGWFPIDVTKLHCPDKLQEYISKGIIREVETFDCHSFLRTGLLCDNQCDHCKAFYSESHPIPRTHDDAVQIELLLWLAVKDYLSDAPGGLWDEFIKEKNKTPE